MAKILLVEDDPLLIDIYQTKLKDSGYTVVVEDNGEEALDAIKKEKPDLILLDIVLPHMDGWEILEALKKNPVLKDSKVIVLSNLGQKEEIEKGMKLGASRYLIKAHYTPSEIVKEVAKMLK